MKFDFYIQKDGYSDFCEEVLENIESFGRMDEYYVLTDYDGNQFIRDFSRYSKIDMWIEDQDEYDPSDEENLDESIENNIVDLFGNKVKVVGD